MPDFTANIVLDIDDSKLKSVEDRLKDLDNKSIDIKLNIDPSALNNSLNLTGSGANSLSATGQKAGLKLGAGIQSGLKIATKVPVIKSGALKTLDQYTKDVFKNNKDIKNQQKQMSEYANRIRNEVKYGNYDALLSKMNNSISKYSGLSNENEKYKKANEAYENMRRINEKLKLGAHDDGTLFSDDDYAKFGKEFQGQSKLFSNSMSIISDEMSQAIDVSKRLKSQADISSLMTKNGRATKKYGTEMASLQQRAANLTTDSDYRQWKEDYAKVKTGITLDGLGGNSVFSQLKKGLSSITRYIGISEVLHASVNTAKQMVQAVRDVDSAMIELQKVSSARKNEIKSYFSDAADVAKEYGSTISDVINATANWSRQGLSLKESAEMARVTTLYKNVGDNIDTDTATQSLVSTIFGFGLDPLKDGEAIVDKFNEVANNYAIDSKGIGDALQRSASSLNAAGNSLDESIGMITAANTVLQDPASVGR